MAKISMMVGIYPNDAGELDYRERGIEIAGYVERAVNTILRENGYAHVESLSSQTGEPQFIGGFTQADPAILADLGCVGVMSVKTIEEMSEGIKGVMIYPTEPLFDTLTYHDSDYVEVQPWQG